MGRLRKRFVNTGPARPPCKGQDYTPLIAGVICGAERRPTSIDGHN